ncbi:TPA: XkdX family protein, partial [Bacillus paranthracis]
MTNTTENTEVRSPDFEKWNFRYQKNWCTKPQLVMVVELERLTPEEYKLITSLEYP